MIELLERAARRGEALALRTLDECLTWGELARRAAALDVALADAGVGAGEAVALWLPNGADWLVGFWGVVRGGRTAVPLSTFSPPLEVARLLRHAGARALLTTGGFSRIDLPGLWERLDELPELLLALVTSVGDEQLPGLARRWEEIGEESAGPLGAKRPASRQEVNGAIAVIQYTSGTTGSPKGARLPAAGLLHAARAHVDDWRLEPGDAIFVPNPFSHILGLTYGVMTAAVAGATTLTLPIFEVEGRPRPPRRRSSGGDGWRAGPPADARRAPGACPTRSLGAAPGDDRRGAPSRWIGRGGSGSGWGWSRWSTATA